jgi:hypothetical protein
MRQATTGEDPLAAAASISLSDYPRQEHEATITRLVAENIV